MKFPKPALLFTMIFLMAFDSGQIVYPPNVFAPKMPSTATSEQIKTSTSKVTPTPTQMDQIPTLPTLQMQGTLAQSDNPAPGVTPEPSVIRVKKTGQIEIKGLDGGALSLAWTRDSKKIFIGTLSKGLLIYDVSKKHLLGQSGGDLQIQALALSPDEKTLAVGIANDNSIRYIDADTGNLRASFPLKHTNWVQVLAFSPDGKFLVSGGDDGKVVLWDAINIKEIKLLHEGSFNVWGMAFSPDGASLLAGFDTERIHRVWDTKTWKLKNDYKGDFANDLAFSPDGSKYVTAGGGIHEANLWDFKTGEKLFRLGSTQGWVWGVAYDPKGKYVVSGGIGDVITLWNTSTGERSYELETGDDFIQAVMFSPDGSKLASAGSEVIIWDVSNFDSPDL